MINKKLINPQSIVVIGGSDDISKPGGKVLKNLIDGHFRGQLYVVNPKSDSIQGVKSFRDVSMLPGVDLAIIAIPASLCLPAVEILALEKETRAFIILSAGFAEESEDGRELEKQIAEVVDSFGGCLLGPNCIGFLNSNYHGVFTTPIPVLKPDGVDFISGSGATAVFIMESAIPNGLTFASVYSVGNSAQTGVEDVLEYLDNSFQHGTSSAVKLLYIENIADPARLLKHASSLVRKGCRIAAIKAGSSEAGSRAASSHTGALASPDVVVDALFRKAGIVRCYSRSELTAVASVFMNPVPSSGRRIAIISHAGGPAVMLTDTLSKGGLEIPVLSGQKAESLREKLFPGSSVSNPVDFLATGTGEQLSYIIDACENDFDEIDAMAVIFGSPGLFPVSDVYKILDEKIHSCKKPIYAILPSMINVKKEIDEFLTMGNVNFPDEVVFGNALVKVLNWEMPEDTDDDLYGIDTEKVRSVIDASADGFLPPSAVVQLLDSARIPRLPEIEAGSLEEAQAAAYQIGFPLAMKVTGLVHKSDAGGVALNIDDFGMVDAEYTRLMSIDGAEGVLLQSMADGMELFCGAKSEGAFGHVILAGTGGIFIEVLKDMASDLAPVTKRSAMKMIRSLKSYPLIKGIRGKQGISEDAFAEIICRLSKLVETAPEIAEMDINPLIGKAESLVAVDTRIRVSRDLKVKD